MGEKTTKPEYDLVLIHGLQNIHRWGKKFIQTLADIWGSERVYVIYTNKSTRIKTKQYGDKTVTFIGNNTYTAGTASVDTQTELVAKKIRILQEKYGLSQQFYVIGHSMGGLVTRKLIYDFPNTVVSAVNLGTPNHGSPLAKTYWWLGLLVGSRQAFANLTPEWVETFNQRYPVIGAPLCPGGKIYTIRGLASGSLKHFGVYGETLIALYTLRILHRQKHSDGLVPADSVLIDGAVHVADFQPCDHLGLARRADVAELCAEVLLEQTAGQEAQEAVNQSTLS